MRAISQFVSALRGAPVGAIVATLAVTACNLDVKNPTVIDAATFSPSTDAARLSHSAETDFFSALTSVALFGGYASDEVWVGAVRPATNDVGRRVADAANQDINPSLWAPLSVSLSANEQVVQLLSGSAGAAADINLARSEMYSGFSLDLMAETFCQGVIRSGPPLTPSQVLDTAIARFTKAKAIANALLNGSSGAEASGIVNASQVGLARAYLQKGDNANAITAAQSVPASFELQALYSADASNLDRLGNQFAFEGNLLTAPNTYVALNDPRVQATPGSAQDASMPQPVYLQAKYTSFDAPIRIASGLEAQYIVAEAKLKSGDPSAALALIAARRAANGQGAFAGGTNAQILAELMDQRSRDFWMEAKHLGDIIRNPSAAAHFPAAGSLFYKPQLGNFGNNTCLPLPLQETANNPNFKP
ncbi:MAG TPA: hypothetical protein VGJ18_07880 [Gemmatimonadaceae bacterium]